MIDAEGKKNKKDKNMETNINDFRNAIKTLKTEINSAKICYKIVKFWNLSLWKNLDFEKKLYNHLNLGHSNSNGHANLTIKLSRERITMNHKDFFFKHSILKKNKVRNKKKTFVTYRHSSNGLRRDNF